MHIPTLVIDYSFDHMQSSEYVEIILRQLRLVENLV